MIEDRLLRLKDIIGDKANNIKPIIPISKSAWWASVDAGRIPKPMKLGRVSVWRESDISKLIKGQPG